MKILSHFLFFFLVITILSSRTFGQSYKESELLTSLQNEYPDYDIFLDAALTVGQNKFYPVNYKKKETPYFKHVTLLMSKNVDGYVFSKSKYTKSFDKRTNLSGKILKTHPTRSGHLILTADTTNYGHYNWVKYKIYHFQLGSPNDWGWELFSLTNDVCTGKNFTTTIDFAEKDSRTHNIKIRFSLDLCSTLPKSYEWSYNWDSKKGTFDVIAEQGKAEVNEYINYLAYPEGFYQKLAHKINGEKIASEPVFIDFEGLSATQKKLGYSLDLIDAPGQFVMDTSDIMYNLKLDFKHKFTGYFVQNDYQLCIEGYDEQGNFHSLEFIRTLEETSLADIKKYVAQGYKPTKEIMKNEFRHGRTDVLSFYYSEDLYNASNGFRVEVNGTSESLNAMELAIFRGDNTLVRLLEPDTKWENYSDRIMELATASGDSEMITYIGQQLTKVQKLNEVRRREEAEKMRQALGNDIQQAIVRKNGFDRDGVKADVIVTNIFNSDQIQVHNILIYYTDRSLTAKQFFDIHHLEADMWKSSTINYDINDVVMQVGSVENVLEIDDKLFFYSEYISSYKTYKEEYHAIRILDDSNWNFISTDMEWSSNYDTGGCEYTSKQFEFSFNDLDSKKFNLEEITTIVSDCEVGSPTKVKSSYRWSSRQNKFLKTLE